MTTPAAAFPLHVLDDLPVAAIVKSSPSTYGPGHRPQHGVTTVIDLNVAAFEQLPDALAAAGRWLMVCEAHGYAVATAHIQRYSGGVKWDDDDLRLAYRTDAAKTERWCPACSLYEPALFAGSKPRAARTASPRTAHAPAPVPHLDRLGDAALSLDEIAALAAEALTPQPAATPKAAADAANARRKIALEAIVEVAERARKATGVAAAVTD